MDKENDENYDPRRESLGWPADHVGPLEIDHLLVLIDQQTLTADDPCGTPLMRRTAMIAATLDCRVTLYAPCADSSPLTAFDPPEGQPPANEQTIVDITATRLEALARWLASTGVPASTLSLWEPFEAQVLLNRILELEPDLVLKAGTVQQFFVGLMTHTDWELLRQAPTPVWYVMGAGDKSLIRHVLTALGASEHPEAVTSPHDYDVCALSNLIAAGCHAGNTIVHTYEMPQQLFPALMPPLATPMIPQPPDSGPNDRLAERHREGIEAFARLFQIAPERVIVHPGRLGDVIGDTVRTTEADLVVMGSRNLSRLQRMLHPVNAEPVLANSPCDVLILPRTAVESDPDPVKGESRLDLEAALLDPEAAFETPLALAAHRALSPALRLRLLKIWEDDVHAEMREEGEGGPVGPTRADLLQRLREARQRVGDDAARTIPQPEFS